MVEECLSLCLTSATLDALRKPCKHTQSLFAAQMAQDPKEWKDPNQSASTEPRQPINVISPEWRPLTRLVNETAQLGAKSQQGLHYYYNLVLFHSVDNLNPPTI